MTPPASIRQTLVQSLSNINDGAFHLSPMRLRCAHIYGRRILCALTFRFSSSAVTPSVRFADTSPVNGGGIRLCLRYGCSSPVYGGSAAKRRWGSCGGSTGASGVMLITTPSSRMRRSTRVRMHANFNSTAFAVGRCCAGPGSVAGKASALIEIPCLQSSIACCIAHGMTYSS